MFVINILNKIRLNKKMPTSLVFLLYSMVGFIVYISRPPYIYKLSAQMEAFWLIVGVLIIVVMLLSEISKEKIINTVIITSIIGGSLTLVSYFSNFTFFNLISLPYAGTRAIGGFDGPNELATFHVLVISLCLGIIVDKKHKINNIYIIIALIISITTIFFTFSRGGLVGTGVVFFLYFILYLKKKKMKFSLILLPLSITIFFIFRKHLYNLIGTFNEVRRNKSDRGYLSEEVMRIFSEKPFFGWGLGSFSSIANVRNSVPHNDFYVFLVSGGIIALLLFSLFLLSFIAKSIKNQLYPLTFFLIIFITQALTFNHLIRGRISILFWIVTSILLTTSSSEVLKGDSIGSKRIRIKHRGKHREPWKVDRPL